MSKALTRTVRLVSLAAIAVSVAACEPDEEARRNLSHFSLAEGDAPFDLGLEDAGLGSGIGDLLPAALPLLAGGGGDYGLAPSWDYARGDYVDYAPGDPYDYYGYDEPYGGYYDDAGYHDDAGYYDQSAGSSDFMWLALAALIASVIGDSPPDYGFDHDGVQPWAWRTGDGYYRLAEPIYGGNRYYYYAPGAEEPFLVRDPYFSYGYQGDRLVALYDRDGRVMDERAARRQREAAQQYLARAEALYRAARTDARTGVAVRDWEHRRGALAGDQRRWRKAKAEQAAWRQWDKQYERGLRDRWQRESAAREQAARRVESWREASYRGPAPRLYAREQTEVQRVAMQRRDEVRPAKSDRHQALVQRRETERDTARSQLALADGRERRRELARERNDVRVTRSAAAEQSRRRDLAVQREERADRARGERQQHSARQDRVRAERQAAAELQQRVRLERQASAERQQRAAQQERARAESQASAERQRRAAQQKQEKAQAERQASAERQQRAAREQQERARAERQAAQRQQQARQVAQQQRAAQQERGRAERQASAERQQRAQQERARAEQQAAQRRQQEQAPQIAQKQQQQQQARQAQRAAQQPAAAAQPAAKEQRGGGRKNGKG